MLKTASIIHFEGLGILIRKDIRKGIIFLEDENSEYQWLKLDKFFLQLKKDIYLCTLYLVPQSSPYLTKMEIHVLETIERDIIEKYNEKGDTILMGDFNARTGSEEDLIISDDISHVPLSDNQYVIDTAVGKISSHDSHIDTRGKELLDMCISNQLRILNGRTFGDSFGIYSCYKPVDCIVVDYAIVSQHLLCHIFYMQIFIFFAGISDIHCKLSFKMLASYQREIINRKLDDFPNRYIWNDKSSEDF